MNRVKKFISRKFFIAVLTPIAMYINSKLNPGLDPEAVRQIVMVIAAYLLGQAAVDVAEVVKNGKEN